MSTDLQPCTKYLALKTEEIMRANTQLVSVEGWQLWGKTERIQGMCHDLQFYTDLIYYQLGYM